MRFLSKTLFRKLCVLLGFVGMVIVNWMAVVGKINGITTAAVSDNHLTMFTPKGYTFSIWGVIYLFLFIYVLFQLFAKDGNNDGPQVKIAFWFVLSCIVNAGWLFAWHYDSILLSFLIMGMLLYCLLHIMLLIEKRDPASGGTLSLEIPFGLYGGWITVATAANLSALLMDVGWAELGLSEFVLVIILLVVSVVAAVAIAGETRNIAYPIAVIWGLFGIFSRYFSAFQWDMQSQAMWIVLAICLGVLILTIRWLVLIIHKVM